MGFNSREYQYSDVKVSILGKRLTGLRGLMYKKSQEKEPVYGEGNDPKAIQRGLKKYDGTLTMLKSDYDDLVAAAILSGYEDLCDVPGKFIDITCVYEQKENTKLQTVVLLNVEFTEEEDGMKSGDKFKEIALPFIALKRSYK